MVDATMLGNIVNLSPLRYLDEACRWSIVLIGMVSALALRRRLGTAVIPLVGMFVLMADSQFYWARFLAQCLLARIGYGDIAGTLGWQVAWRLVPTAFAAVMAFAFVAEVRRIRSS